MTRCHVLPGRSTRCDRGTFGCDACEHCTCHWCYAHPAEECICDKPRGQRAILAEMAADARTTVQEVGPAPTNGTLNVPIPHDDAEREL